MPHLQVKNVPEETYADLRRRAQAEGTTIRDYVLRVLQRELARPSLQEWLRRVDEEAPRTNLSTADVLEAIDAGRDEMEGRTW